MRCRVDGRTVGLLGMGLCSAVACGGGSGEETRRTESPEPFPTGAFVVVSDAPANEPFAIAHGDDDYLVAFADDSERGQTDIVALRLSSRGVPAEETRLRVSDPAADTWLVDSTGQYSHPGAAYDGREFGVSFYGRGAIRTSGGPLEIGQNVSFARVPPEGSTATTPILLDTEFLFSSAYTALAPPVSTTVAGGRFLTTYSIQRGGSARARSTSTVLVSGEPASGIAQEPGGLVFESAAASTSSGDEGLVVRFSADLSLSGSDPGPEYFLRATYHSGDLRRPVERTIAVLGTAPASAALGPASIGTIDTAVASEPDGRSLVAWTWFLPGDTRPTQIYAIPHERNGEPRAAEDAIPIATSPTPKELGGISFATDRYLVVWEEGGTLLGRHVERDGDASETFEIDPGPVGSEIALASDGDRTLVLFARPRGVSESRFDIEGVFVD